MINTDKYDFSFSSLGISFLICEMKIIHLTHRTMKKFELEKCENI